MVIGSSGAGKSIFSGRLHKVTGLKLIHLNKLYWKPNWIETTDKNERRKILVEVLCGEKRIIDGNYSNTPEMPISC